MLKIVKNERAEKGFTCATSSRGKAREEDLMSALEEGEVACYNLR